MASRCSYPASVSFEGDIMIISLDGEIAMDATIGETFITLTSAGDIDMGTFVPVQNG